MSILKRCDNCQKRMFFTNKDNCNVCQTTLDLIKAQIDNLYINLLENKVKSQGVCDCEDCVNTEKCLRATILSEWIRETEAKLKDSDSELETKDSSICTCPCLCSKDYCTCEGCNCEECRYKCDECTSDDCKPCKELKCSHIKPDKHLENCPCGDNCNCVEGRCICLCSCTIECILEERCICGCKRCSSF